MDKSTKIGKTDIGKTDKLTGLFLLDNNVWIQKGDKMPLAFESLSHGQIAFGFFNIETDMILLEHYFFYAEDFCRSLCEGAEKGKDSFKTVWEVYWIQRENIGNLMGAIHGIDLRGFLGEVYKLFPFPRKEEEFKQNPEGYKNRTVVETLIQRYGKRTTLSFMIDEKKERIAIGKYIFNKPSFQELTRYIWRGGYPRWKDEIRPGYVIAMKDKIDQSNNPLFDGLLLN
jgi:hypothetical protein